MFAKEELIGFFPKLTPKRFQDLLNAFGDIDTAWQTTSSNFHTYLPWNAELIAEFCAWRNMVDEAFLTHTLEKEQISLISFSHPHYPTLLKEISDPPPCLFVRGVQSINQPTLAIVGTRSPSTYGMDVIETLLPELIEHHIIIVSGLAFGIDALVHKKTIDLGGTTVAILGSGCDDRSIAPQTNLPLAKQITEQHGLIMSEYPPYTEATTYTFPRRNRIIAGLSLGTLVIEAGESSGALITAKCSLDYNREVFAVPQPITSKTGHGVNELIKQGATPVTCAGDILAELNIQPTVNKTPLIPPISLTPDESHLYSLLSGGTKSIDEMTILTGRSAQEICSTLSILEIKSIIKSLGGSLYTIPPR